MKYLLFAGSHYYPNGGWEDFKGDFDSVEAAQAQVPPLLESIGAGYAWWHIVDVHHKVPKIVMSGVK